MTIRRRLYRLILRLARHRRTYLRYQRKRAMRLQRIYDAGLIEAFAASVEDSGLREQLYSLAQRVCEGDRISLVTTGSAEGKADPLGAMAEPVETMQPCGLPRFVNSRPDSRSRRDNAATTSFSSSARAVRAPTRA